MTGQERPQGPGPDRDRLEHTDLPVVPHQRSPLGEADSDAEDAEDDPPTA